jgi:hypothetical protein
LNGVTTRLGACQLGSPSSYHSGNTVPARTLAAGVEDCESGWEGKIALPAADEVK